MATAVIMPKMGMTMEEGTIVRWFKREGERVEKGEPLLEIMTDKVSMDIEAPASGMLRGVTAGPNVTVPVAQVIAYVVSPGESVPGLPVPAAAAVAAEHSVASAPQAAVAGEPIAVSPLARRLAREAGLDLGTMRGTGPAGRIVEADVKAALGAQARAAAAGPQEEGAPAPPPGIAAAQVAGPVASQAQPAAPVAGRTVPLTGRRKTMAQRMALSASIPQFTLGVDADMTQAEQARGTCSPTAMLVRVVAHALQHHPMVNACFAEGNVRLNDEVNIGVAVSVDDGLVVPVVKNAGARRLLALDAETRDLAERARSGKLSIDEVTGATFTIYNLGMFGIEEFRAPINPPEVAILAVARITPKPVAVEDGVVVRPVLHLVVSADHRVLDGATVATFLVEVKHMLENPYLLF